jgi:hypothetical protein
MAVARQIGKNQVGGSTRERPDRPINGVTPRPSHEGFGGGEHLMQSSHRQICQRLAVVIAMPLAPFWLLFAVINFPWIVPADHSGSLVSAHEGAALAGIGLATLSVVSMLWAAGVFGQLAVKRSFALVLLGGLATASAWLYPAYDGLGLASLRLPMHAAGVIVVLLGAAGQRSGGAEF